MYRCRSPIIIIGALHALAICAMAGQANGGEKPAPAIGADEFNRLCTELHVKNQPWATIPWKVSVTEARIAAAKAKKPIFLVINTGNCLGIV
jgi:hypothetical protein